MTWMAVRALLGLALAVASAPAPGHAEKAKAGSLADQIAKAMPETPDTESMHRLHYALEIGEGVEVGEEGVR